MSNFGPSSKAPAPEWYFQPIKKTFKIYFSLLFHCITFILQFYGCKIYFDSKAIYLIKSLLNIINLTKIGAREFLF